MPKIRDLLRARRIRRREFLSASGGTCQAPLEKIYEFGNFAPVVVLTQKPNPFGANFAFGATGPMYLGQVEPDRWEWASYDDTDRISVLWGAARCPVTREELPKNWYVT